MAESSFVEKSKVSLKEGDFVYKKGEMAEQMYVVMSGKVRLYLAEKASGEWSEELVKGDFFGEGSLLEFLPRETTAVAMEDSDLISISRGTFVRMIRQNPEVSVKMLQRLTQRNRELVARIETESFGGGRQAAAEKKVPTKIEFSFVSIVSGHKYVLESHGALVGRFDPSTGIMPDIDLTADDSYSSVSRRHARVFLEHGKYFIAEEAGVANGTYIQGERLEPGGVREIADGDRINFGAVALVFQQQEVEIEQPAAG
jgi:CRP-like cAMP-binding protein